VALVARVAAALIVALPAVVAVGDRGGPRPWGAPAGLTMGGRRAQRRLASPGMQPTLNTVAETADLFNLGR